MLDISEKENFIIKNLQAQEKLCIDKYTRNENDAKDPVLKGLFGELKASEQRHYDSLTKLLSGTVEYNVVNDNDTSNYNPIATYVGNYNEDDKNNDQFLCTDSITTEKYVSSAYNFNIFQFADSNVRKMLNDIETEEQNHAERIHKYKTVNQMN